MKAMAEKLRKWIIRRIGGYTREETAKKDALPKELRDVLLGKAPGVYTSREFLKVCKEQPKKEEKHATD